MENYSWSMIDLDDRCEWDSALNRVPHSFAQTWEHCQAFRTTNSRTVLLDVAWSGGEVICPLVFRGSAFGLDVATTSGCSGLSGRGNLDNFPGWWRTFAISQDWISGYLVINPWLRGPPWRPEDGRFVHNSLFSLDLTDGEQTLYARLSRTRHRQIRAWSKAGIRLVDDREVLLDFVLKHAEAFYDRINVRRRHRLSRQAWMLLFASGKILVLGVSYFGRIVAMTVFGLGDGIADAMWNISVPEGRDAATFLMWNGARILMRTGVRTLNMGGGSSSNDAVAEAKRRFGGTEVEFAALRQVYDRTRYNSACLAAGCEPSTVGAYFPPYRTE